MASVTLNPSLDGKVGHVAANSDWTTLVAGAGTTVSTSDTDTSIIYWQSGSTSNKWDSLFRSIYIFDLSALFGIANSATLRIRGTAKNNLAGSPTVNVFSASPASLSAIVAGDFDSLGSTAFSSNIAYASWSTSAYNEFILNASGIAAIQAAMGSKVALGVRDITYDLANSAPTYPGGVEFSQLQAFFVDNASSKPELVLDYTPVSPNIGNYAFFM